MKKLKLVIILLFLLFLKQLHCEPDYLKLIIPEQTFEEDELSYKTNEDYNILRGILPSAQVFFNIIPEVPVALSFEAKTKDYSNELYTSKTKIILNLLFQQVSVFCRYSSTFIQIYLRTACFRL
jgi:hypothetical protein